MFNMTFKNFCTFRKQSVSKYGFRPTHFIFLFLLLGCEGLKVGITPLYQHINTTQSQVTFTCTSPSPITACQFSWLDTSLLNSIVRGPVLDLSLGAESTPNPVLANPLDGYILNYTYIGRGLEYGDCGVTMVVEGHKHWLVMCRLQNEDNWFYNWAELYAHSTLMITHIKEPNREMIVAPEETKITLTIMKMYDKVNCKYQLCRESEMFQGHTHNDLQFFRDQRRRCFLELSNVDEEDNGLVQSFVYYQDMEIELRLTPLIFTRPPSTPELTTSWSGDVITATCRVNESRPAPNITWFLDGKFLLNEDNLGTDSEAWWWPWRAMPTRHTLTHRMRPEDSGKVLKCSVTHLALVEPKVAEYTIPSPGEVPTHLALVEPKVAEYTIPTLGDVPRGTTQSTPAHFCPPLKSETVRMSCRFGDNYNECGEPQRPGTIARMLCQPGYYIPHTTYREISCLDTGKWSRSLFECIPDCGKRKSNHGSPLLAGGSRAKVAEFPWHVAIYRKYGTDQILDCGGTLITRAVVLTAAHCFWDVQLQQQLNISQYTIVAGKILREWNESRPGIQRRRIRELKFNNYGGRARNFQHDIALAILNKRIQITDTVNLACVHWGSSVGLSVQDPQDGAMGVVAGWGYMLNDTLSTELRYLELPYIARPQCFDKLPPSVQSLLTSDKFCAGYRNMNKSTCRGDSGGGLLFQDGGRYYVRGVLSNNFKPSATATICYAEQYTAFTVVSQYLDWIQNYV